MEKPMDVVKAVQKKDDEDVKKAFVSLLSDYLSPAFGSISKRDFDILLFMKLQELGAIDKNPEIYELVSDLRVTRAKARNLLYEAKLRASSQQDLDEELRGLMDSPIFLKESDKIGIEVGNPYLIDHLRFKLKKLNHITDGSFSPELVKLTTDAYIALFRTCLPAQSEEKIVQAFVDVGAKGDTSFKGIMTAVLGKLGSKVADEAGSEVAKSIGEYLGPVLNGSVDAVREAFGEFFGGDDE
jgi:hypothetical protein